MFMLGRKLGILGSLLCFMAFSVTIPMQAASEAPPVCSEEVPIHISLTADVLPTVGQDGAITATVTCDYDLPNVTVDIELPTEGKVLDPPRLNLGKMRGLTPTPHTTRVRFLTPGNKFVRAVARAEERPGVVWSVVAYLPLNVGATKSQIGLLGATQTTEAQQTIQGTGKLIGRPTFLSESATTTVPPPPNNDGGPNGIAAAADNLLGAGLLVVTGNWKFYDRNDVYTPQRDVLVELRRASDGAHLEWAYTNWSGDFTFPAITNPGGVYVRCYTYTNYGSGNEIGVVSLGGVVYGDCYTGDTSAYTFADGTQSVGTWHVNNGWANEKAWWIHDDCVKAFWVPADHSGRHVAEWSPTSTHGTHYHPGGNIHLKAGDADDTPDTVLHEMGHSVMYNIYGNYMPATTNCNPHSLVGSSSTTCGWTEGWAQIWHCWTTNDAIRSYPGGGGVDLETATWGSSGWDQGDTVEGRVAGAVWDITDAANDGTDTYNGSWSDVWDVMWNVNCDTFAEFWSAWKSRGHAKHGPVASIYQCTIDYNTWPTFGGLTNVTTNEDVSVNNAMDLWLFASDPESSDSELVYEITGNTNANCGVSLDSLDFVDVNPVANWNGSSTVTISCSDGVRTRYDSFVITVNAVNDAPVITGLPDKSLSEDASLNNTIDLWAYTIDADNSDSTLTFTVTGNTNSNCGVSIDTNRYIDINPTPNWNGYSDVTIRTTDPSGLYTENTFRITVNAVNDPPTISTLPDRSLNEDTSLNNTIDLWAFAYDPDNADSSLTFTITGNTNPSCGVSIDSGRYIDINPAANWNGNSDVTIRVADTTGAWVEDTFRITVNPINDPPVLEGIPDEMVVKNDIMNYAIHLPSYASDVETPSSGLTYTITANTNPSCGAAINGFNFIDIVPAVNWTGNSYVTIRATDPSGGWDEDTFEIVVGEKCATCAAARSFPDGTWVVIISGKTVTASFSGAFYIEDSPTRVSGVRVSHGAPPAINKVVNVAGQVTTYYAERMIDCHIYAALGDDPTPPMPLGMPNKSLGGASPNAYTPEVPLDRLGGLYNVGLLTRTTGTVMKTLGNYFWIDDGSHVPYSSILSALLVDWNPAGTPPPPVGARVAITGISGATTVGGDAINLFRPRMQSDVTGCGGSVVYIYDTDYTSATDFSALMNANHWSTQLAKVAELGRMDISKCDVIVIGNDTGIWTVGTKVSAVMDTGKPVIGIGSGGAQFLDKVLIPDLSIGWGPSAINSINSGTVTDPSLGVYYFDIPITIPVAGPMPILATTAGCVEVYNPPVSVVKILRDPQYTTYWPVAQEDRFMQWGYYSSPANMTNSAKSLFLNCLYYMQGK
ncbi:MAG: tandem-95 repeat protein [Armatimonadota bacterium]